MCGRLNEVKTNHMDVIIDNIHRFLRMQRKTTPANRQHVFWTPHGS